MAYQFTLSDEVLCRTVAFDKVQVSARAYLSEMAFLRNHLHLVAHLDQISRQLVLELRSFVLGKKAERIDIEEKWPADWWQAVKERWLPAWFLKRYPVQYKTLSIHKETMRVCPHVDMKTPEGRQVHFRWLEGVPTRGQ